MNARMAKYIPFLSRKGMSTFLMSKFENDSALTADKSKMAMEMAVSLDAWSFVVSHH